MPNAPKKLGPYQFLEKDRWENFLSSGLGDYPGEYLMIINSNSITTKHPVLSCFNIEVTDVACHFTSVTLNLEWIKEHNPQLSDYNSVFLVNTPSALVKVGASELQKNFFHEVLYAFSPELKENKV